MRLDLVAYCLEDLVDNPFDIKRSEAHREWMDETPNKFAYRCLPLVIANQYGWTLQVPHGFSAIWNGGEAREDVIVRYDDIDLTPIEFVSSHFGSGTITFNFNYIFRTTPGIDLYAKGPSNLIKDGIQALEGVIETDWLPFTFTMNWKFTRPFTEIRFEHGEPFCQVFPVVRGFLEQFNTTIIPASSDAEFKQQVDLYSQKRKLFNKQHYNDQMEADKLWQKFYFRGLDAQGLQRVADHKTNVKSSEFEISSNKIEEINVKKTKRKTQHKKNLKLKDFKVGSFEDDHNTLEYYNPIRPKPYRDED